MRNQRGFTIVELIACIVIVAILGAIAAPNFSGSQTFVARGYADEIAASLRYARRIAIASGCSVQVTIDAAGYRGRQRRPVRTCNAAGGVWNQNVVRADRTALTGVSPAGVNVAPDTTIEFQKEGNLAGGSVNIQVGARVITVVGATGEVSMQ